MPMSSEDSLSENVYIEMPESVEVLTRSVPYHDGINRNYPGNFPDMHLEPKQRSDDIAKPTWRDAFDGKWPYTTPLFYKSEEETLSKLQEQTRNLENIQRSSTSLESSQWEGSIRDIWSGSQRNVNEAFEVASSDQMSVNKAKGCEKSCRRFLCVFLGLSILGAILAGVGLTLILTSYNPDNQLLYRQGDLIDPDLSIQEKKYLTQTFCNLVKLMLKGTEFPTESGIASCRTALRLSKETESLQIELLISPEKGFTIKEKFRRALKEEILAEGAYRINGSNTCLYAGDVRNHITCKDDHSNDGDAGLLLDSAATSNVIRTAVSKNIQERKTIDRSKTKQVIKKNGSDKQKSKHSTKVKDSGPDLSLNTGADATHAIHTSTTKRTEVTEPKVNKNINYMTTEGIQNLIQPSTSVYSFYEFEDASSTPLEPSYGETYKTTLPSSKLISENNSAVSTEYDTDAMTPFRSSVTPDYSSSMIRDMYDQSSIHNDYGSVYVPSAAAMNLDQFTGTTDLPSIEWNRSQSSNVRSTETSQYNITSKTGDNIRPKIYDINFKADEVVTHMKEFETQTKNNTVATLNSIRETSAAILGKTLETKTTESVIDTAAINSQLNAKQNFDAASLPTVTAAVNDMPNEISVLDDTELPFRLNLYGTSKSKNYLRFPIVTGSNGKFLFSPLSNKDTIDIAAKPNVSEGTVDNQTKQNDTKAVTKIITVNATNEIGNMETTKQKTVFTKKVKPKPMIVDWRTPPAAKPTNFPKGWESRDIMFNAGTKKGDPAGSKVSFSVPRLNQANFF